MSGAVEENCGYVVWKDRNTVIFYTNHLDGTPDAPVMLPNEHAIKCVRGLVKIRRWMGTESLHPTIIEVPAVVMTYNLFMNGVGRFDQLRASHTTARKERRVPMYIFTFLLDASVINAYALYKALDNPSGAPLVSFSEFKRQVAEHFVTARLRKIASSRRTELPQFGPPNSDGNCLAQHIQYVTARNSRRRLCFLPTL